MPSNRLRLFEDSLGRGLSPLPHTPVNAPVLSEGYGFRPLGETAHAYVPVQALGGAQALDWPFPQLHAGQSQYFAFDRTTVRLVTPGSAGFVTVPTYDARNPSMPKAIPAGGPWHVADWGTFYMATNGACLVYLSYPYSKVLVETQCYPKTLCAFRDRSMFGNIVGYQAEWSSFWHTWLDADMPLAFGSGMPNLYPNSVAWGSIEGGDALLWFRRDLAETGYLAGVNNAAKPQWLEKLRQNQVGYEDMPWTGEVLCVKALDNAVVVYGTRYVSILMPVNVSYPTFGRRDLAPIGLAGRAAVAGDETGHVFVSSDGILYRVSGEGQIERIEYGAQFAGIAAQDPVVTYDPYRGEYRISARDRAYLLTPAGLVECPERTVACVPFAGALYGRGEAVSGRMGFKAVSWPTDLGTRGLKNLTGIELGARNPQEISVALEYRNDLNGPWKTAPYIALTREGYGGVHVTAVEFRVTVAADAFPDFDYVDLYWNAGGKAHFGSLA
jgi:hypothetical protein